MPLKRIKTLVQQSQSGNETTVLLEGGTYDSDLDVIDPGEHHWVGRLETSSRDWSHVLTFVDGSTLNVDPRTVMLEHTRVRVLASPDRP